jgi:hypothetical protein
MDVPWVASGSNSIVTSLVTLKFKDDDDDAPMTVPTDFVLLADVSGSMSGAKIASVRDALLKLSDMFGPADRVALVTFNNEATQQTALAPLRVAAHEAAFRRAAMTRCNADGGTDLCAALACAERILASRAHRNPAAQVLLLTDGQDGAAAGAAAPAGATLTTMGFGADHDAELLTSLASRSQPRGTFTFVSRDDMLDETMAAYVGDVTRVLTLDARAELTAAPGTRIARILASPGEATLSEDGSSVRIALGAARVDDSVDILLELAVSSPAHAEAFETLRVVVTGAATDDSGAIVRTPPLIVSFAPPSATASGAAGGAAGVAAPEAAEAIAAAQNRQQLALAAATIAAAEANYPQLAGEVDDDEDDDEEAAPEGGAGPGRSRRDTGDVATSVIEAAHAATAQRSLMGRSGTGKGGRGVRCTMQVRKGAR